MTADEKKRNHAARVLAKSLTSNPAWPDLKLLIMASGAFPPGTFPTEPTLAAIQLGWRERETEFFRAIDAAAQPDVDIKPPASTLAKDFQ
jgi:hypothetical protein